MTDCIQCSKWYVQKAKFTHYSSLDTVTCLSVFQIHNHVDDNNAGRVISGVYASVCLFVVLYNIWKSDTARITKLDTDMVHHESWEHIYWGQKVKVTWHKKQVCIVFRRTAILTFGAGFSQCHVHVVVGISVCGVFRSRPVLAWVMPLFRVLASSSCITYQQFTLTGRNPISSAASTACRTLFNPFRRVINSNLAGTRVSRLMLSMSRPASRRAARCLCRTMPFVVIAIVSSPESFNVFNWPTFCTRTIQPVETMEHYYHTPTHKVAHCNRTVGL